MGKVDDRVNFIIHILRTEGINGLSISEVHERLYIRFLESCSRRTVERELLYLEGRNVLEKIGKYPAKFKVIDLDEKTVQLTGEEIQYLHKVLKHHFKDIKAQSILSKINY